MSYPCTRCGVCCQNLKYVDALKHLHFGDGVCRHYSAVNGCTIYHDRPVHCQIDKGYEEFFSEIMDKSTYYRKNAETCNALQEKVGLETYLRVTLI